VEWSIRCDGEAATPILDPVMGEGEEMDGQASFIVDCHR
jgi:hypothetical protein